MEKICVIISFPAFNFVGKGQPDWRASRLTRFYNGGWSMTREQRHTGKELDLDNNGGEKTQGKKLNCQFIPHSSSQFNPASRSERTRCDVLPFFPHLPSIRYPLVLRRA